MTRIRLNENEVVCPPPCWRITMGGGPYLYPRRHRMILPSFLFFNHFPQNFRHPPLERGGFSLSREKGRFSPPPSTFEALCSLSGFESQVGTYKDDGRYPFTTGRWTTPPFLARRGLSLRKGWALPDGKGTLPRLRKALSGWNFSADAPPWISLPESDPAAAWPLFFSPYALMRADHPAKANRPSFLRRGWRIARSSFSFPLFFPDERRIEACVDTFSVFWRKRVPFLFPPEKVLFARGSFYLFSFPCGGGSATLIMVSHPLQQRFSALEQQPLLSPFILHRKPFKWRSGPFTLLPRFAAYAHYVSLFFPSKRIWKRLPF